MACGEAVGFAWLWLIAVPTVVKMATVSIYRLRVTGVFHKFTNHVKEAPCLQESGCIMFGHDQ